MAERGPLRPAGRAACELDVDRVGGLLGGRQPLEMRAIRMRCGQVVETEHPRFALLPQVDHELEVGQCRRVRPGAGGIAQSRYERPHDSREISAPILARQHQRAHADQVEGVPQLVGLICRIDRHQDQPGAGACKLNEQPFRAVRRPDADPVPGVQPHLQQARRQPVDRNSERPVGPSPASLRKDRELAIRPPIGRPSQRLGHGLIEQRGLQPPLHGCAVRHRNPRIRWSVHHPGAPDACTTGIRRTDDRRCW